MFVIFYRLDQAFFIESKLLFELINNLHVYLIQISNSIETLAFWLVKFIPRMVSDFFNSDPFIRIRYENLRDHIFSFF